MSIPHHPQSIHSAAASSWIIVRRFAFMMYGIRYVRRPYLWVHNFICMPCVCVIRVLSTNSTSCAIVGRLSLPRLTSSRVQNQKCEIHGIRMWHFVRWDPKKLFPTSAMDGPFTMSLRPLLASSAISFSPWCYRRFLLTRPS